MEIWKDIKGFGGHYQVSNLGRVRSFKHGRISMIKLPENGNGYYRVNLTINGKMKRYYVHRLVAECFLEPDETRLFVNHKNSIRNDNRVSNLEWCTVLENYHHARLSGKHNDLHIRQAHMSACRIKPILDSYTGVYYYGFVDYLRIHGGRLSNIVAKMERGKKKYARYIITDPIGSRKTTTK